MTNIDIYIGTIFPARVYTGMAILGAKLGIDARSRTKGPIVVVVVEDEPLIRMTAVDVFGDEGFNVLNAKDAREAVDILEANADRIDILFTDVRMPGLMDGLALAHHSLRHWPWIALLVTSGQAISIADDLPKGGRFISKPYNLRAVVRHIQQLAHAA